MKKISYTVKKNFKKYNDWASKDTEDKQKKK